MFLLMTVNGWVFLSMALGFGVGSFLYYPKMSIAKKHEKEDSERLNKVNWIIKYVCIKMKINHFFIIFMVIYYFI